MFNYLISPSSLWWAVNPVHLVSLINMSNVLSNVLKIQLVVKYSHSTLRICRPKETVSFKYWHCLPFLSRTTKDAIQEQNNHDWWSISWRFCTISPTQLPSLYDLRHSTTCVRSQIWWLQFNSTRSNFPVSACSGGVQQGAQGGAWLRRIPGDKDGHFWMWALTLETKKFELREVVLAS